MRIFSSLTKKGLYLIVFPVEGNSNSKFGAVILGNGMYYYEVSKFIYWAEIVLEKFLKSPVPVPLFFSITYLE